MATNTPNYGFTKPELSDTPPDITATNGNWDTVDTKLKSLETAVSSNETIDEINEKIGKTTDTSTKSTLFGKLSDIGTKITNIGTILSRIYPAIGTQTDPNKTGSLAQRLSYVISWIDQIWFELYDDDDSSTIAYGIKDIRNSTTQIINKLNDGLESENVDNIWEQVEPQSTVNRSGTLNQKVNYLENSVDSIERAVKMTVGDQTVQTIDMLVNPVYGLGAIAQDTSNTNNEISDSVYGLNAIRRAIGSLASVVADLQGSTQRLSMKQKSDTVTTYPSGFTSITLNGSGVFYYGTWTNRGNIRISVDDTLNATGTNDYGSYDYFGARLNANNTSILNGSSTTDRFTPIPFKKSLKISLHPNNQSLNMKYSILYALYQ